MVSIVYAIILDESAVASMCGRDDRRILHVSGSLNSDTCVHTLY